MKRMKVNKSALVAHIVLICFVLFCTLPTLLLVTSSLSDNDSVFRNGYSFGPKSGVWKHIAIWQRRGRQYSVHTGFQY